MNKLFHLVLMLCFFLEAQSQTILSGSEAWVASHDEPGHARDITTAMVRDDAGNLYVTGFSGTVKFNALGVQHWAAKEPGRSLTVDGAGNVYVTDRRWNGKSFEYATFKYNSAGSREWLATYKVPGDRPDPGFVGAIVVDGAGNVYVVGHIWSNSTQNYFTIKYNSAGNREWIQLIATGRRDVNPVALALDKAGNVYVAGSSWNKSTYYDLMIVKYSSAGKQQWVTTYNEPRNGSELARALVVDDAGNVYVTGGSWNDSSNEDFVTVKYNSSGTREWAVTYNGSRDSHDDAQTLAVDGAGNVYVAGRSWFGSTNNYVTIKYNSAGTQEWVQTIGIVGSLGSSVAFAVDSVGNAYVAGHSFNRKTGYDYVIVKYNFAGIQKWRKTYNGPGNKEDHPVALVADEVGNIYVVGNSFGLNTSSDYAVSKYNASGVKQWTTRYDLLISALDAVTAMQVDSAGNTYVTGYSVAPDYVFHGSFTIKYDAAGSRQWVARLPFKTQALAIDQAGNAYVTGFGGTIKYNSAGSQEWAATTPGNALATDRAGNVYVVGKILNGKKNDYVTIKYNSAGAQEWLATYNGPGNGNDEAVTLCLDNSGYIYVTGYSWSGTSFDFATIKYNAVGQAQWVARYGRREFDRPTAMAVDSAGNVYVTGMSYGPTHDDYATVKFNSAGIQKWAAIYGFSGHDYCRALAVDGIGNVYVTGSLGTVKYDSAGNRKWVVHDSRPGSDFALGLDATGNIYVTGQRWNGAAVDLATIRYNAAGTPEWRANYRRSQYLDESPTALGLDAAGNVYVATTVENSGTGSDIVTIKYATGIDSAKSQAATLAEESSAVTSYELAQNYPNPFWSSVTAVAFGGGNPGTTINFALPMPANVKLNVYDMSGRLVRTLATGEISVGRHVVPWNGRDNFNRAVAAGAYLYQLVAETEDGKILFSQTRRMTLLK